MSPHPQSSQTAAGEPHTPQTNPSSEPFMARYSTWLGGAAGKHLNLRINPTRTAAWMILGSAAILAGGIVQKHHCLSHNFSAPDSLWRGCYSDLPLAANRSQTSIFATPETATPLADLLGWVSSWLAQYVSMAPWLSGLSPYTATFAISALIITGAILLAIPPITRTLAATQPPRPMMAAHLALSPLLALSALISWDALAAAIAAMGLAAWLAGRPRQTAWLLAAAVLISPVAAAVSAAIGCGTWAVRPGERAHAWWRGAAIAAGPALGLLVVVLLGPVSHPGRWFSQWWVAAPGHGALTNVLAAYGWEISASRAAVIAVGGILVGILVAAVAVRCWQVGPAAAAGLILVVAGLTAKELPVQYAIWLLPILVFSRVSWRTHALWLLVECTYFALIWAWIAGPHNPGKAMPLWLYSALVISRLCAWLLVVAQVVWADRRAPDTLPKPSAEGTQVSLLS